MCRAAIFNMATILKLVCVKELRGYARFAVLFFSLACDETTYITNTAQLAIFVRGITAEFDTSEELLSLQAMHGTTKGEDLFEQVCFGYEQIRTAV